MYETIVVGTDGTESSFLAIRRAAAMAMAFGSRLVLASAYFSNESAAASSQRGDSRQIVGEPVAEEVLAEALAVARDAGAVDAEALLRAGSPVEGLMAAVRDVKADLLVVGNRGINSLTGRLLGSVPADVARQSDCDVMIVHTVGKS